MLPYRMKQEKPERLKDLDVAADDIVLIYTNDVHGGISGDEEYSGSATAWDTRDWRQ